MLLKSGVDSKREKCAKYIDNLFLTNYFGGACLFVLFSLLQSGSFIVQILDQVRGNPCLVFKGITQILKIPCVDFFLPHLLLVKNIAGFII